MTWTKEQHNEYHREYQRKVRAEIQQDPECYKLHKEKVRLASQKFRKANPQKCRDAVNKSSRKRYHNDPEFKRRNNERSMKTQKKRYYEDAEFRANKIEKTKYSRYGLSPLDYVQMVDDHDNKCAACGAEGGDTKTTKLHVDHCHKTGDVRGLLCMSCNLAAGLLKDDPQRLNDLTKYLERKQ